MFKKVLKATGFSKQEQAVAHYMKEVRDIQDAKLSRRDLFKMGLTAGVGGLAAIGGKNFLPNMAYAKGGVDDQIFISPRCTKPWTEALPIPKAAVSRPRTNDPETDNKFQGPAPDKDGCKEGYNYFNLGNGAKVNTDDHGNEMLGDFEDFEEARTETHQRWGDPLFGDENDWVKYELRAMEFDWNFYSKDEPYEYSSKVWTYADMNSDAMGPLRINAHYGQPILMRMYNCLPKNGRDN